MKLFGSPHLTPSDICLWGWMKKEVWERKVDTPDEMRAGTFDAAVPI